MIEKFKSIGKHSGIYIFSQLSLSALGFLLLPLFSFYLSPAEFGTYSIILSVITILTIFLSIGINSSLTVTYFDNIKNKVNLTIHISSLFWFLIIWSIFILIITIGISEGFDLSSKYEINKYILLVLFISITSSINSFYGSLLRSRKKSIEYSVFTSGNSILVMLSTILLLISFSLGIYSPLIPLLIFNILFAIFAIYKLFKEKYVIFTISKKEIIHSLKFSLPFVPHLLSGFINQGLDKIILLKYETIANVGIYSMGSQIGSLINIILMGINMAWAPFFHEMYREDKEKHKEFFGFIGTYIILIMSFLVFGLSLFSKELVELVLSENYYESYKVIPIIALSFLFFTFYTLFAVGLFAEKKSKKIASSTISGAIINIILNFVLIPKYGFYGAAFATLISQIVVVIVIYFQSRNIYKFPFQKIRILKILFIFSLFYLLSYLYIFDNILVGVLYKFILIILSMLFLYIFNFFDKDEIKILKNVLNKKTKS